MFSRKTTIIIITMFMTLAVCAAAHAEITAVSVEGDVRVIRRGSAVGSRCEEGTVLNGGDWVSVPEGAHVLIAFDLDNENTLYVGPNTLVAINEKGSPERAELFEGTLIARLKALREGESFKIRTPVAVCGARGTAWRIEADGILTNISVFKNDVFLRPLDADGNVKDEEYMIHEGYSRSIRKNESPSPMRSIDAADFEEMKNTVPAILKNVETRRPEESDSSSAGLNSRKSSGIILVNGVGVNRDIHDQRMAVTGNSER